MNKKHIATTIGVVFLTTGVIGGIISGINAMPSLMSKYDEVQSKFNENEVLYDGELNISKLSVELPVSHIEIRHHNKNNVLVERTGNKDISNITINNENNELIISEESKRVKKDAKNVDDIVQQIIDEIYTYDMSTIVIYLPKETDIDVKTINGYLNVEKDVVSDTLNFETNNGNISLDPSLSFKNLNIKSNLDVYLSTSEMYGIKNIKVESYSVNIHDGSTVYEDSIIPNKVEIYTLNSDYYNNISIDTNLPIAKNLTINSNSNVRLDLPILKYKFNFNINTLSGISYENSDYDKYVGTPLEKYFNEDNEDTTKREFIGVMNESLLEKSDEYVINIESDSVTFE
ncbi:hypothetical protein [Romboutsia sp. Marseille-P6047]|uniref:hypothetical protein n=1 Tax=Romboutsia sp. Marseille-P6047 TaxID=2161817 RepID=UPI000F06D1D8|nr:hypothetical protein [Romboutsia sp. Marseille-P6047]